MDVSGASPGGLVGGCVSGVSALLGFSDLGSAQKSDWGQFIKALRSEASQYEVWWSSSYVDDCYQKSWFG